jgi:glucosamine--fructose-6-phosphate aminotransferase (isomerizing)
LQHTRDVFYLGEKEIAILTKDSVRVTDFDGNVVEPKQQRITWDPIMAEKGGFKHFLLRKSTSSRAPSATRCAGA